MATEKKLFTAYDGTEITFFPNSHRYQRAGEKTYLLSPSSIVGVLDKSRALLAWNDGLIRKFFQERISESESYDKGVLSLLVEEALTQRTVKLEEAQDVGSQIHDFAEHYAYLQVMGETLPTRESIEQEIHYDEQVKQGKLAFLDFIKENQVEFVDVENFVYGYVEAIDGSKIFYSGKFDVKMKIKGKRCLGDWKSSKGVYTSQKYQLGGYDLAETQRINYLKALGKDTSELEYDSVVIIHIDKNTGMFTIHELSDDERTLCRETFKALTKVKETEKKLDKWEK